MQHPLGVLVQCVPAALEQAVGDLHQQVLGVLRLYVRRHGAQQHGAAAKVRHIQPGVFQQGLVFQQRLLFLCGKVDGGGLQQQLAGHVAVVDSKFFVQLALMGGVLVDQAQLVSPLCQNIGAENFAHIPQRLFSLRYIKAQLLRLFRLFGFFRLIGHRGGFDLRGGGYGVPCRHVIQQRVGCGVRFRVHIQLRFTGSCPEGLRRGLDFGCIRFFRAVEGDHRIQNVLCGGRLPPRRYGRLRCRGSLL